MSRVLVLTLVQYETLKLACTDLTNSEIAEKLHRSKSAIDNRMYSLYKSIGCRNRMGAIIYAYENGLVEKFKNEKK